MSDAEREEERLAAARADLVAYMRTLPKNPPPSPRPIRPGRSAFGAFGMLMRLRVVRMLVRVLVLLAVSLLVRQFVLPGGGVTDLGFVSDALWNAVGTLQR